MRIHSVVTVLPLPHLFSNRINAVHLLIFMYMHIILCAVDWVNKIIAVEGKLFVISCSAGLCSLPRFSESNHHRKVFLSWEVQHPAHQVWPSREWAEQYSCRQDCVAWANNGSTCSSHEETSFEMCVGCVCVCGGGGGGGGGGVVRAHACMCCVGASIHVCVHVCVHVCCLCVCVHVCCLCVCVYVSVSV